jgi:esterase/lipase
MKKSFKIECVKYSISADWYEGSTSDRVLLILMGFTSTRSKQEEFTNYIVRATGASALVIDYSGHGESPFILEETRPAQQLLEVIYAYEWIKANYPKAKISVIGNSYGSFLAAHLVRYKSVEQLVLRAPAIYRPDALYDLWSLRLKDENTYRHSIEEYRTNEEELMNNPLFDEAATLVKHALVVVHEKDEIIPRQTSDAYIRAFNADSFIMDGFSHSVSQSNVSQEKIIEYQEQIARWLKQF